MRLGTSIVSCWIAMACTGLAHAQVPPTAAPDQMALLKSADPKLAANKKLVFDMWRAIIQGAHTEMAPQYFTEGYIQHNPNVATGRAPGHKYAGTHFDMFRIEDGKIAEHWDSVAKDPGALHFDPNTQNKP